MSLVVTVSGSTVSLLEGTAPKIQDTLDQRSKASFKVFDSTGTVHFQYGQAVSITDSVAGLLFTGYVNDATEVNYPPNAANEITVNCFDQHYLADKRVSQVDYTDEFAGDIVADLASRYLSQEGVTASYTVNHDSTATDFASGILSSVVAASNVDDGDLELAPAGTTVTISENFQSGASTNLTVSANQLTLGTTYAIQMVGTQTLSGASDAYRYEEIWRGAINISTNDTFTYDLWVSTTSPECKASVDFVCSDGTLLRTTATALDAQGLSSAASNDLTGYANGKWYSRLFTLPSALSGKSLFSVRIGLGGAQQGTYTAYFKNIIFTHSGTPTAIFTDASHVLQTDPAVLIANAGYTNVSVDLVTAYYGSGTRVSNPYSIGAATLVKESLATWTITTPSGTAFLLETSTDGGATYQPCSRYAAIPQLLAGMRVGPSRTLILRETLSITGSDPIVTPTLSAVSVTVVPAAQASTTDVVNATTDFSTGTLTNLIGASGSLVLTGNQRNWDTGVVTSQTVRGPGSPTQQVVKGQLTLTTNTVTEATDELTFAGNFADFTAEIDLTSLTTNTDVYGLAYRCTALSNNAGSFAYAAVISNYSLTLYKGQNNSAGGSITTGLGGSFIIPSTSGTSHRLKVVVSGNVHKLYIDEVLYITYTDSSSPYTATGKVALYYWNKQGVTATTTFDNFGVTSLTGTLSGTRVAPSVSLSTVGTIGTSVIGWNGTVPETTSVLVEISLNGGSTYSACTNGGTIPGLTPGLNVSTTSLLVRVTLSSSNIPVVATLTGLSWWVTGQYSASGSRVGLPLNLSSVGRAGSTLVNWDGIVPANTTLSVDTSLDNNTWTNVGSGAAGSAPIAGITSQIDPIEDTFDTNTGGFYTSTYQTNGTQSIWTWDTTNSRLTSSGGTTAQLLYNSLTVADIDLVIDMDLSDAGGLVWRQTDSNNFYDLTVGDASSPTPGLATLCRIAGNTRTTLATAALSWTRGTPHRIRATMFGGAITVYFDGTQIITYTDNHPFGAGRCGLRTDTVSGASAARFYLFHAQAQGDSVVGKFVYTRVRFTSTDPTVTPQLTDITTSVRSAAISNGAFIPSTTYSVLGGSTNSLAQCLDDLAKQSNNWWRIDKNKSLFFQPHNGTLAPFVITNTDMLYPFGVSVKRAGDLYRNIPYVLGGTDTILYTQSFVTDGISQTFTVEYPVDSLASVSTPSTAYSFGIKGVDTGRDYYYQIGNNTVNQDPSEVPLPAGLTLTFTYNAQINVVATTSNASQIAAQAALEGGTSGMVEVAETAQGLNRAAASQLAASRLTMYGTPALTIQFTTARVGFAVGQQMSVFLPQHQLTDQEFLISDMSTQWRMDTYRGSIDATPYFTVTGISGPILNSWASTLSGLGR